MLRKRGAVPYWEAVQPIKRGIVLSPPRGEGRAENQVFWEHTQRGEGGLGLPDLSLGSMLKGKLKEGGEEVNHFVNQRKRKEVGLVLNPCCLLGGETGKRKWGQCQSPQGV